MEEVVIKETSESVVVEVKGKKIEIPVPLRTNYEEILVESDDSREATIYKDICEYVDDVLEAEGIRIDDSQYERLVHVLREMHEAMLG